MINGTFKTNLAGGAKIKTLHSRGADYKPSNMVDNNESSYYATSDAFATDVIMLQEVIELGHRTTGWSIDYSTNGKTWTPIPEATGNNLSGINGLSNSSL